tara:strand:- start:122443 stop:123846 length:1404 start_codon:yes stop_codon:yes gene_type:complete
MTNKFSKKAFNPSQGGSFVEEENKEHKRFKMCYSDHDTHVVRCAKMMQEDYIEARHISSGRVKEFPNKTCFGVNKKGILELTEDDLSSNKRTDDKGRPYKWLAWTNKDRQEKGQSVFRAEDFEVLSKARLNPEFDTFEEALDAAEKIFASHIKALKRNMDSEDYTLLISGKGNYRDYESKTVGYKSSRGEKPIYFQEFKDKISEVYKNKIWWAKDNEAEDLIQYIAKQQTALYGYDQTKWDSCAAYIDKDVTQCYIPAKSYDNYEDGWFGGDLFYCEKTLVAQTISGDPTDTIEGLPSLTESVTKHFGLRKSSGVSKSTAEKLLDGSETFQEMWKRAVYCYQQYYGFDKEYNFKDVHGEDQCWTWIDYMQQCYVLVKMQEYEGQIPCVREYLSEIGVPWKDEIKYGEIEIDTEGLVNNLKICKSTLAELESILKSYKSLPKPKLIDKLDEAVKLKDELKGNISLLEV